MAIMIPFAIVINEPSRETTKDIIGIVQDVFQEYGVPYPKGDQRALMKLQQNLETKYGPNLSGLMANIPLRCIRAVVRAIEERFVCEPHWFQRVLVVL